MSFYENDYTIKERRTLDKEGGVIMRYVCSICGYVYDESQEQVAFSQLPDSWVCPICKADQSLFVGEEKEKETINLNVSWNDPIVYSTGEEAAICSNLARGCEKQYKDEEMKLFQMLSDYLTSKMEEETEINLKTMEQMLQQDLSQHYPALHHQAEEIEDRGTQRICVWGEKVTGILHSLLMRYQQSQGLFLRDTDIWVCSVCGFVFVGDNPPDLCPVCKVPAWKFEKIEGREQS